MKNKMKKLAMLAIIFACSNVKAETLTLEDNLYSVTGIPVGSAVDTLAVRWGTWNSGTSTFTQTIFGAANSGYATKAGDELAAYFNATSNSTYSVGTQFAVAFFAKTTLADCSNLDWNSTGVNYGAVLTDASWIAPAFNNTTAAVTLNMGSSTSALKGSYSYNSGNQGIGLVNLAAVPEPSVASLFALGTVGLVALRARRKS